MYISRKSAQVKSVAWASEVRLTSMDASLHFPSNSFDLVFLDARHDYFAVVEDVSESARAHSYY